MLLVKEVCGIEKSMNGYYFYKVTLLNRNRVINLTELITLTYNANNQVAKRQKEK